MEQLISGTRIAAVKFDNLILLNDCIPFHRLRELGCVDGANLVTSKAITHDQLLSIVKECEAGL
jgi:hypothetical protein